MCPRTPATVRPVFFHRRAVVGRGAIRNIFWLLLYTKCCYILVVVVDEYNVASTITITAVMMIIVRSAQRVKYRHAFGLQERILLIYPLNSCQKE